MNGVGARPAIVVMGVSGSGKSSVGAAVSMRLAIDFVDGDDLHPAANILKMASGTPLTDDDRWPWLDIVGDTLADARTHPLGVAVACSALRRIYRDRIRAVVPTVRFLLLATGPALIEHRLAARTSHFMPTSLVASQFAALELPQPDERDVATLDASLPLAEVVATAVALVERWAATAP